METLFRMDFTLDIIGSYPTYEEWKRVNSFTSKFVISCSYPTYEEWKLYVPSAESRTTHCGSYPTYEEWKLLFPSSSYSSSSVLILPMRNGNPTDLPLNQVSSGSSYPTYEEWKQYGKSNIHLNIQLFLSYL